MQIRRLETDGYRNLEAGAFIPSPDVNILYGDNGQGKTNLLEAIWLFTGGRSFRGAKDAELTAFDREAASLSLTFIAGGREQEAAIAIRKRRSAVLNGIAQPAASRLAGVFCAVVFSPVHLSLIKDGPEGRRRFLDAAYCQLRPGYVSTLSEYHRALIQRNALLRQMRRENGPFSLYEDLLDAWDARLGQAGTRVEAARAAYVRKIQPLAAGIYDGLSRGKETLSLAMTGSQEDPASLPQRLRRARAADIAAGFTTVGPHRADLEVRINGKSGRAFGSQGQQRSAVLALKLAEASLLKEVTGEQPVALLDDVMSELDVSRQDYILNHIEGWQVFITCCDPFAVRRLAGGRTFHMEAGRLTDGAGDPAGKDEA